MSFKDLFHFKKKKETLPGEIGKEIYPWIRFWNICFSVMTIVYVMVISGIPFDFIFFTVAISGIWILCVLQTISLRVVFQQFTHPLSEDLISFYQFGSNEKERMQLLKKLMMYPERLGLLIFILNIVFGFVWFFVGSSIAHFPPTTQLLLALNVVMGAYYAGMYATTFISQSVCARHGAEIVKKGIPKEEVEFRHFFGIKTNTLVALVILIPICLFNLFFYVLAWRTVQFSVDEGMMTNRNAFIRLGLIAYLSIVCHIFFSRKLFKRMMITVQSAKNLISGITKENLHKIAPEKTDLGNEFTYNIFLLNKIIDILQKLLKENLKISMDVIGSSNELSVIARETAVTSLQQNSGVKELLSVMEETDALSKTISEKIGEVSIVAKKTTDNIADGFDILKQNVQKLDEIKAANDITVDGIKKLTEKINGISDIVRIINSIADQTNLIAFNAEIEASSAGEIGENFALVANEIRRLTNSTIKSTDEIRRRITEIQHSSEQLLLSSQNGSSKITDETNIIIELNKRFEALKNSSQTMDYASEDIRKIIEQQTASFAQVVVTLRQISQASESFSVSTQKISELAQSLCTISENLRGILPKELLEEYNNQTESVLLPSSEISTSEVE